MCFAVWPGKLVEQHFLCSDLQETTILDKAVCKVGAHRKMSEQKREQRFKMPKRVYV